MSSKLFEKGSLLVVCLKYAVFVWAEFFEFSFEDLIVLIGD
jgi:hypothetical protein